MRQATHDGVGPILTARSLAEHLDDPSWRVIDCRHDLSDPALGRRAWAEAHIPGAIFWHLDEDLSGPRTGTNGRHPLPSYGDFVRFVGACGIMPETRVVVYDDDGGMFAARAWWMLRWIGHRRVAVLDGGWNAWRSDNLPFDRSVRQAAPCTYPAAPEPCMPTVTADELLAQLGTGRFLILDARSPDRYRGENEALDPVAGHIPGAVNRFYRLNLDEHGRFRPPEALRAEFAALLAGRDPSEVVHQCGSGVTACHNLMAMEWAGLCGSRLYPGSWSEWCADPRRPIKQGPEP
jgi:thiosulfate/3-mercaptopyruvate sulfurtransferase